MTLLVTSIVADNVEAMKARALQAIEEGSDAVELRLDALKDQENVIAGLAEALPSARWVATCRPVGEGGFYRGSVEHRVRRLLSVGPPDEGFIDFEFADWQRSPAARHDLFGSAASVGGDHRRPTEPDAARPSLILSYHDFERRPVDLPDLVDRMCAVQEATAIKIVWPADGICANFDALDIMHSSPKPAIAICMGEVGLISRVLASKCGAFATYCAFDAASETAPGQLTLAEMKGLYRWDKIDESSQVYGVIGHPVAHSLSPILFNDAFAAGRVDGVYLPLLVEPTYEAFAAFLDGWLERPWLDARGFSVTLPHKVNAIRYLGDRVDPPADRIGAVNTLVIDDGEVWGCNTDWSAAIDTLTAGMGCGWEDLDGVPVDVLGAGGVARAVLAGLSECGCAVTVFNRTPDTGRSLAEAFDCTFKPWDERVSACGKILINCTNVGMWPDVDDSPMPADALRSDTVVFDTVYSPVQTRLLNEAAGVGCRTISGLDMFLRQAAAQFEYWTQQSADLSRMSTVVQAAMQANDSR